MAQWRYETFCTELNRSVDFDAVRDGAFEAADHACCGRLRR
jgi:hypothetical protein